MDTNEYLFVYGTLRAGSGYPMGAELERGAVRAGGATLQARLYRVSYYPGAVLSNDSADQVFGDLFRITDSSIWPSLDRYEGCGPEYTANHEYQRCQVQVLTPTGEVKTAWCYLYRKPITHLTRIASGDFLQEAPPPDPL